MPFKTTFYICQECVWLSASACSREEAEGVHFKPTFYICKDYGHITLTACSGEEAESVCLNTTSHIEGGNVHEFYHMFQQGWVGVAPYRNVSPQNMSFVRQRRGHLMHLGKVFSPPGFGVLARKQLGYPARAGSPALAGHLAGCWGRHPGHQGALP